MLADPLGTRRRKLAEPVLVTLKSLSQYCYAYKPIGTSASVCVFPFSVVHQHHLCWQNLCGTELNKDLAEAKNFPFLVARLFLYKGFLLMFFWHHTVFPGHWS